MSCAPFLILAGGLIGAQLAPTAELATLPIAMMIVGSALATIPTVMVLKRFGRKRGSYVGYAIQLLGIGAVFYATLNASWAALLVGTALMGVSFAFAQQYRFAALESLKNKDDFGTALAVMMSGGLVAAYVGPELAASGRDLIESATGYAGSCLLLAGVCCVGALIFGLFKDPVIEEETVEGHGRSLLEIARGRFFLISIVVTAVAFGVMSLVMTATPVNMNELCGYSLMDSKWVIQSHLAAMFLPSFLTPLLMRKLGQSTLMMIGAAIYVGMIVVALMGQEFMHFWWALILLGVGWNFLFVTGTALLPRSYRASERFKTQALNDFIVFGIQATASLSAGWLLFSFSWEVLVWVCLPAALLALAGGAVLYFEDKRRLVTAV